MIFSLGTPSDARRPSAIGSRAASVTYPRGGGNERPGEGVGNGEGLRSRWHARPLQRPIAGAYNAVLMRAV